MLTYCSRLYKIVKMNTMMMYPYERAISKLASINRRSIYYKRRGFYKGGRIKTGWSSGHRTKTGCLIRKLMRLKIKRQQKV
jgi:hypothetical protein